MLVEVLSECRGILWYHHHNFGFLGHKLVIVLTQLRHVPAAEWSGEAAIENQQYMFLAAVIRKFHNFAIVIVQFESRSRFIQSHFTHHIVTLR